MARHGLPSPNIVKSCYWRRKWPAASGAAPPAPVSPLPNIWLISARQHSFCSPSASWQYGPFPGSPSFPFDVSNLVGGSHSFRRPYLKQSETHSISQREGSGRQHCCDSGGSRTDCIKLSLAHDRAQTHTHTDKLEFVSGGRPAELSIG